MSEAARQPSEPGADRAESSAAVASALLGALRARFPDAHAVEELRLLSGGASQESWSFDLALGDGSRRGMILRRSPTGARPGAIGPTKEAEARLQVLARAGGVPVAEIVQVLAAADGLGTGYVMQRVEGEVLAPRILREEAYAEARTVLAHQCGQAAARIHQLDRGTLPELRVLQPATLIENNRKLYASYGDPHPVFDWAFRWLVERAPAAVEPRLVHGDFRNGNLIVGSEGLRAVLDWEGAHLGDPMEDLGWISVYSWRFGGPHPVGGFGRREDLFAGYQSGGGGRVDPAQVRWWEIFGSLRWGIVCQTMGFSHLSGYTRSVEKAAIGRRSSETEVDLLNLILVEEGL